MAQVNLTPNNEVLKGLFTVDGREKATPRSALESLAGMCYDVPKVIAFLKPERGHEVGI